MRPFVITTESNNDLSPSYLAEHEIHVIPHYYNVEDAVYGDEKVLSNKEFYDEMRAGKKVGTAASNPAVIEALFTSLVKAGNDIIHISFSSALSAGCSNVMMVAKQVMEEYPDAKIVVVDSLNASLAEGLMIMKAVEYRDAGSSLAETVAVVSDMVPHLNTICTVEDLEYLYRGGRLSKTSAVVGSIIQLKPILGVNKEGGLGALAKVRGRNKSFSAMVDLMGERLGSYKDKQMKICIIHGDCEADALRLQQMITDRFGYTDFCIEPIGPSIGAHTGPGTVGLIFLGE